MPKLRESLFDNDDDNEFNLWDKHAGDHQFIDEPAIHRGYMYKFGQKSQSFKNRLFVLTSNRLYCCKSSKNNEPTSFMRTKWVRVEYADYEEPLRKGFGLKLIRNGKHCQLLIEDLESFVSWKQHMSKVFIQSDFHSKYRVVRMIGKGAFASVYQIEDNLTKIQSAVKVFDKNTLLIKARASQALMNEVEITKFLNHSCIVKLEEIHETSSSIFLVQELLEGGELFNKYLYKNDLPIRDLHRVLKSILLALVYLAENNIIHRDLKPENIMVKEKGELNDYSIKLIDFGLAVRASDSNNIYKKCGTRGYVAPEIISQSPKRKNSISPKCDVFSAGVTFYKMACHTSHDKRNSLNNPNFNDIDSVDFQNTQITRFPHLDDLLQKMLEPNPNLRISAHKALQHDFFRSFEINDSYDDLKDKIALTTNIEFFNKNNKANSIDLLNTKRKLNFNEESPVIGRISKVSALGFDKTISCWDTTNGKKHDKHYVQGNNSQILVLAESTL
jgi:serine/threonine protein kinase